MLNRIIEEIKKCIENECFISALTLALTIPDICGKAEHPLSNNTDRYIEWYNTYIGKDEKPSDSYAKDMPYPSGALIYNLRNSLLHQGTPSIDVSKVKEERCKVDKFVLTISSVYDSGISSIAYGEGMEVTERTLKVSLIYLCNRLCAAAKAYYNKKQEKFNFFEYEIEDMRRPYAGVFKEDELND